MECIETPIETTIKISKAHFYSLKETQTIVKYNPCTGEKIAEYNKINLNGSISILLILGVVCFLMVMMWFDDKRNNK